jgi:hypothetical protein
MADYEPLTEKLGNLQAICPECSCIMYRRISTAKLDQIGEKLEIRFPQALRHISEGNQPTLNSDLK